MPASQIISSLSNDWVTAGTAPPAVMTTAGELQKVTPHSWSKGKAKHVANAWKSKNKIEGTGYVNVDNELEIKQIDDVQSFVEGNSIKKVNLPKLEPSVEPKISLQPLTEWEGYVTEINKSSFKARLTNITLGDTIEREEARFLSLEVPEDDRRYIAIGAIFRFIVGYNRSTDGDKKKTSKLFFRKRPNHSPYDLMQAKKEAQAIVKGIVWE